MDEDLLDLTFALANPLTDADVAELRLDREFDELYDSITASPQRGLASVSSHRSRVVATAIATGVLIASGGAVAAADWTTSHTGEHGPAIVGDTSEWLNLDGDDFDATALKLSAGINFPPGDSAANYIPVVFAGGGQMTVEGVKVTLSLDATCAWWGVWLQANSAHDQAGLAAATQVLSTVPSWPIFQTTGAGNLEDFQRVAQAAAAGDAGPIQSDWSANCTELPRHWAAK